MYDFNRDALVNATDTTLATNNATTAGTALKLIATPAAVDAPPDERLQISLFNWGDGGYPVFNIPGIIDTGTGTTLAFAEGRSGREDFFSDAMVMRRSTDGGVTWSSPTTVYSVPPISGLVIGNPTAVVDRIAGKVFLLFGTGVVDPQTSLPEYNGISIVESDNDGLTWSAPTDITSSVKVTAGNNPGPPGLFPDTPWGWIIVGPGHGIQLQHGEHAGRLLIAGDHRFTDDTTGKSWSHVMYSDDHGQTWHLGGGLVGASDPAMDSPNDYANESTLVERSDGSVYMSIRVNASSTLNRGQSISTDGGMTWSTMELQTDLTTPQVHGSLLRLNDDVLLFSSPSSTDRLDNNRHEMAIWLSYDDGANWTRRRVVFFGYAGYSDMTLVGPDTILLTYTRGWTGGLGQGDSISNNPDFYSEITLARVNLRWLESDEPYEFNWYFNELEPGAKADYSGSSIQDYGPWDQRAWALASANVAAQYVAGAAGDTAIQLTGQIGARGVLLSQAYNTALHAGPDDSFTVQIELKTSDATGVIIGTRPTVRNWALQVVGGKVQFSLFDGEHTAVIVSDFAINDGNWHHIAAVRDATGRLLKLYVDHVQAATPVIDTATRVTGPSELPDPIDPVYLGIYNTGAAASKLDVTVDTLRFTRAALAPEQFFSANLAVPSPPPPPIYPPDAPTSLPGLKLWLPAYDPTKYFGDYGSYAIPLPLTPFDGMATRSMIEASDNAYRVQIDLPYHQVLFEHDADIGPYWLYTANPGQAGTELRVFDKSTSADGDFDFVQNTGTFTLSTFVNAGASTGGFMTIFDTNRASSSVAGFSLFLRPDGQLSLSITGGAAGPVRFNEAVPEGTMTPGEWYHVAVVGNGPGNPIKFYITPVSASQVTSFDSADPLVGANGTYPNGAGSLFIGSRSNQGGPAGEAPFNGGLVNQAIFNQALTPAQIQQLFLFGKGVALPAVSLSPAVLSQAEGGLGTKAYVFTVTLSEASLQTVTVNFATADGSATTAGNDYQTTSGVLTFSPSETTKQISVLVNGDMTFEPDETFDLTLSAPVNATLANGLGVGTILNDDSLPSAVVARQLFYNGSGTSTRYDHNDLAINSFDDLAIATDKTAYLWEDAGAATFANVSSYTKGINGIMVEIAGSHGTITAADFIFRVGNNNSPGLWTTASAPTSVSVRAGAGVSGSDRVEIIWNTGAPFAQWLEVITLANANTGLAQKVGYPAGQGDAFFFGNAPGNTGTGDTGSNSLVNSLDEAAIRANNALVSANIPITNVYDVGRNASVNVIDESAARLNGTNPSTTLKYLNLTTAPAAPEIDGGDVSPLVAGDSASGDSASGDNGVASALTVSAPVGAPPVNVPKWISNRLDSVDLNSGAPARFFHYLHDANTPRSRALLEKFDAVADALGLDDELLDALLADLS